MPFDQLLYAQKMWNHVLPRLIEGDKEVSGETWIGSVKLDLI